MTPATAAGLRLSAVGFSQAVILPGRERVQDDLHVPDLATTGGDTQQ